MAILLSFNAMHRAEEHALAKADLATLLAQIFVKELQEIVSRQCSCTGP